MTGVTELALLLAAGFVAGSMNAVAGGGSFVGFPAMVAAGLPAVVANASNTVALVPGTLSSAWVYRGALGGFNGVSVKMLLAISGLGGLAGGVLLLATPAHLFDGIIPWLLLVATITFSFGKGLGEALRRRVTLGPGVLMGVQFVLGIYGGYFGGAVGIMLMAAWSLMSHIDRKALSAVRTLLVSAMNAVAVVVFVLAGAVSWPETLAMMLGGIAGGTIGAKVARRIPSAALRKVIVALTWFITALFFVRAFRAGSL